MLFSWWWQKEKRQNVLVFFASAFLVSIPVFFQAPLVRLFPLISLLLTFVWIQLSFSLKRQPESYIWGDILWGFSWSWLCGSIYWGWLRDNPAIHIPIEAIGLPFALWCIWKGWGLIGNYFYLGSLIGTAITDLYFYIAGLIPYWRELMITDPSLVKPILQSSIAQVQTVWGISWAVLLANVLLGISLYALQKKETHYIAFAGAVLSTIFTDALFLIAAYLGMNS
nr:DUF3120 domain-containing protein [Geminocystis sp. NIES-3709]